MFLFLIIYYCFRICDDTHWFKVFGLFYFFVALHIYAIMFQKGKITSLEIKLTASHSRIVLGRGVLRLRLRLRYLGHDLGPGQPFDWNWYFSKQKKSSLTELFEQSTCVEWTSTKFAVNHLYWLVPSKDMRKSMSSQITSLYTLSSMDKFMSFQVSSLSIGFTTIFAGMWLLSALVKLMIFQVVSLSVGFTTIFADMFLLSAVDKFMHF